MEPPISLIPQRPQGPQTAKGTFVIIRASPVSTSVVSIGHMHQQTPLLILYPQQIHAGCIMEFLHKVCRRITTRASSGIDVRRAHHQLPRQRDSSDVGICKCCSNYKQSPNNQHAEVTLVRTDNKKDKRRTMSIQK